MDAAIEVSGLAVHAGRLEILDGITFRVERGEFLAVLGPNGAGKTTLLQALWGGVVFSGRVVVLGKDVAQLGPLARTRWRRQIGYVPQLVQYQNPVLPLTVRQVVELGRIGVRGSGARWSSADAEVCRQVMEEMDLIPLAERSFTTLSGGEQRKVHLARALAQQPEVLLLDEPAGHLDFRWQEQITALLARVWRQHRMTMIMVTHDLRHLPDGMACVALLKGGRLLRAGAPHNVLSDEVLSDLYGLPLHVVRLNGRYVAVPKGAAE